MKTKIREKINELIELKDITDPCDSLIEYIATIFPGEYTNENEYVNFQIDIGRMVMEKNLNDIIDSSCLYEYLIADSDKWLNIFLDKAYSVGEYIYSNSCIGAIQCPGFANIDSDHWTKGWTEKIGIDKYKIDFENDEILTLKECVERTCKEGDVSEQIEDLKEKIMSAFH